MTKTINLMPEGQKKELELEFISQKVLAFWVLIISSLAVFIVLAFLTKFYLSSQIKANQGEIAVNNQQLSSADYKALHDQILSLNNQVAEIKNLGNYHYDWSQVGYQLSNIVTPDMQFNEVDINAATGEIDVAGQSKSRDAVLNFWANVIKSQYFTKINFPLTNLEKPDNVDFKFTFYVNKQKFLDKSQSQ